MESAAFEACDESEEGFHKHDFAIWVSFNSITNRFLVETRNDSLPVVATALVAGGVRHDEYGARISEYASG